MSINCSVSGGHGLRGTTMTITEIAKMAGVSVSAVSRYLNDGYISEEKRRKIKEVKGDWGDTA